MSNKSSNWAKKRWVALATGQKENMEEDGRGTRAAVFWDLDNKPPVNVPPLDAALRLKELAANFGQVVDFMAYANRHAFEYVPEWVREERREAKQVEMLERRGIVMAEEPYICGMCGRKFDTSIKLKKHFKQLHERERQKRFNFLKQIKSNKRAQKFKERNKERDEKYLDAARDVITPKRGYRLMTDLRRAGVHVRQVSDKPQAADIALMHDMDQAIASGMVDAVCLVSDDRDFTDILNRARYKKLCTIVIGSAASLKKSADLWFSWDDVASGKAIIASRLAISQWANQNSRESEKFRSMYEHEEASDEEASDMDKEEAPKEEESGFRRRRFEWRRQEVVDEAEWYEIHDPPRSRSSPSSSQMLQISSSVKERSSMFRPEEMEKSEWEEEMEATQNDKESFGRSAQKLQFDAYPYGEDEDEVDFYENEAASGTYNEGWAVEDDDFFKESRSVLK